MARTVKHFSLHRIPGGMPTGAGPSTGSGGTELRVVSDVAMGVLPVIQEEIDVIQNYSRSGGSNLYSAWSHRWVTLFILQDMQPLIRQLSHAETSSPTRSGDRGIQSVAQRPVVNIYDLANPDRCHVFINHDVMVNAGYWGDLQAVRGLLAHEHAHPIAENETIRSSRALGNLAIVRAEAITDLHLPDSLLVAWAEQLSTQAPSEIFANECAIRSGFGQALQYLDQLNVANAVRSLAGRETLHRHLQQQVAQGTLGVLAAELLLFFGDLESQLNMVLEIAAFYRAGWEDGARELEATMETDVFAHFDPRVAQTYADLRELYITLTPDLPVPGLVAWCEDVWRVLTHVLAEKGLETHFILPERGRADTHAASAHQRDRATP